MGAPARFHHCQEDSPECAGCVENAVRKVEVQTLAVFTQGFEDVFAHFFPGVEVPAERAEQAEAKVAQDVFERFNVVRAS